MRYQLHWERSLWSPGKSKKKTKKKTKKKNQKRKKKPGLPSSFVGSTAPLLRLLRVDFCFVCTMNFFFHLSIDCLTFITVTEIKSFVNCSILEMIKKNCISRLIENRKVIFVALIISFS
jgi:hypothetical protein